MSRYRLLVLFLAVVSVFAFVVPSFSADEAFTVEQMMSAKNKAVSYEKGGNSYLAWGMATKYSRMAEILAADGTVSKAEAELAEAWRDSLEYSPELYVGKKSQRGVFFGSDGAFVEGSSAVKLNVPFGVYVEDFYNCIPAVNGDLLVLVSLEVSDENTLRQIAFGHKDDYITKCMKQAARIEGRVYVSFCPGVNTMRYTFTLAQSFKDAFARVSELCDRYAPDAEMVYTLSDVRRPAWNTVGEFYPGDEYVDAFGAELYSTYVSSAKADLEAAYDSRGEYGDPILSVRNMVKDLGKITEKELPLLVAGCSFPWNGTAALSDWAQTMERFYALAPTELPNLVGVLYSNKSSAEGYCNLRQNPEAFELYKKCLGFPWYAKNGRSEAYEAVRIDDMTDVLLGEAVPVTVYTGGVFRKTEYALYLDSVRLAKGIADVTFTEGEHILEAYSVDEKYVALISYTVAVDADGKFSAVKNDAEFDYNKNGIMDFGDVEMLNGYIAKWSIDLGGMETDINGDGKTNLRDASALRVMMSPTDTK